MRPYFYDGKPVDADDPNRHRVLATAELVLDTFEWIWLRRRSLNADGEWGWRANMTDTFSSSPALQQHYLTSPPWYPGITRLIADCSITLRYGTPDPDGAVATAPTPSR